MDKFLNRVVFFVFSTFSVFTFLVYIFYNPPFNFLIFGIATIIACALAIFRVLPRNDIKNPIPYLLVIMFVAFLLRVFWVYLVHATPVSDFYTYHSLAEALTKNELLYPKFISLFPHVFGYSAVLSVFYAIFGAMPMTAVYLNIALNMGILFLIYSLGKSFYNLKTGLVAAAIYAFWPSQIYYNALVITEAFYTFGLLFILFLYSIIIEKVKGAACMISCLAGLGILAGLLKYIRPASMILLLSILIHYLFIRKGNPSEQKKFPWTRVLFSLVMVVSYLLTSHIVINSIERFIGVETARSSSGFYIAEGLNIETSGKWCAEDSAILEDLIRQGMGSPDIQEYFSSLGFDRLKHLDILSHIRLQINKNRVMWGDDSESIRYISNALLKTSRINLPKYTGLLVYGANGYYMIFLILSFLSFFLLKDRLSSRSLVLYLYVLGTVAAHLLVEVFGRYHYSVVSLLCILSAAVIARDGIYKPSVTHNCLPKNSILLMIVLYRLADFWHILHKP